MAADPARRRATYEDILSAPADVVAEVLDGTLYAHPRPDGPHAEAQSVLGMDLGSAFHRGHGGPGGWTILFEPELHLGPDIVVPDLAGWHRERLPAVPDAPFFELAPDWACEVLSPTTALVDRRQKLPIYARESVGHLWLVDPRARLIEVLRLDGETYRLVATHGETAHARIEPFEAIALELGALWPDAGMG
jgi:Uma2 family endonuclease